MSVTLRDGALSLAAHWIQGLLVGPLATACAVLAIAGLGLAMLQGHLSWHRGGRVVMGCFILFAANSIALGLVAALGSPDDAGAGERSPPTYRASRATNIPYDPYAGAALPDRSDGGLID